MGLVNNQPGIPRKAKRITLRADQQKALEKIIGKKLSSYKALLDSASLVQAGLVHFKGLKDMVSRFDSLRTTESKKKEG